MISGARILLKLGSQGWAGLYWPAGYCTKIWVLHALFWQGIVYFKKDYLQSVEIHLWVLV